VLRARGGGWVWADWRLPIGKDLPISREESGRDALERPADEPNESGETARSGGLKPPVALLL